ncbi:hypothetical protein NDU88_010827 [Pleurodeles waltl]|uniref:Uncharacterized protein n=1 Tax=Pleurodeles waltl TaxID=8319 RepID=A0AAV7QZX8_PLEWA|nr:hypothetical protein NDU88_010827 [Pleurodeles waltl]
MVATDYSHFLQPEGGRLLRCQGSALSGIPRSPLQGAGRRRIQALYGDRNPGGALFSLTAQQLGRGSGGSATMLGGRWACRADEAGSHYDSVPLPYRSFRGFVRPPRKAAELPRGRLARTVSILRSCSA